VIKETNFVLDTGTMSECVKYDDILAVIEHNFQFNGTVSREMWVHLRQPEH
jgi:hypothetical protein